MTTLVADHTPGIIAEICHLNPRGEDYAGQADGYFVVAGPAFYRGSNRSRIVDDPELSAVGAEII